MIFHSRSDLDRQFVYIFSSWLICLFCFLTVVFSYLTPMVVSPCTFRLHIGFEIACYGRWNTRGFYTCPGREYRYPNLNFRRCSWRASVLELWHSSNTWASDHYVTSEHDRVFSDWNARFVDFYLMYLNMWGPLCWLLHSLYHYTRLPYSQSGSSFSQSLWYIQWSTPQFDHNLDLTPFVHGVRGS